MAIYQFANSVVAYHIENHSGVRAHENDIRIMTERGTIVAGHNWDWSRADAAAKQDFVHVHTGEGREGQALPLPAHLYQPAWHGMNPWQTNGADPFYDLAAPVAGFMGTMGTLLHAAGTGVAPLNPIEDAIASLRIALAAQHSAETGQPVDPRALPDDFTASL